jgi:large conductance mechanosensitive channel
MSFVDEFKKFALRGNMVDLAIGVIIGAAFGKVVSSLVNDMLMPPIGVILGGVDFSNLSIPIKHAMGQTPAVQIKYGAFINNVIDFLIVAFVTFAVIKFMNTFVTKPSVVEEPKTKECPECLMPIPLNAKRCGHCTSILKG